MKIGRNWLGHQIGKFGVWLCDHCEWRPLTRIEGRYAWQELKSELNEAAAKEGFGVSSTGDDNLTVTAGLPEVPPKEMN